MAAIMHDKDGQELVALWPDEHEQLVTELREAYELLRSVFGYLDTCQCPHCRCVRRIILQSAVSRRLGVSGQEREKDEDHSGSRSHGETIASAGE